MGKTSYATIGQVYAIVEDLATKIAQDYESVGVTNIAFDAPNSSFIFTLADGSQESVAVNISARGVSFNNASTGFVSTNVQNAIDELKYYIDDAVIDYIGREQQIDFEATLSGSIITCELHSTISTFEFTNSTGYLIYVKLPLATVTGDLPDDYTIIFKDKDNNDIVLNCIYNISNTQSSTVGQMCEVQRYDASIGYEWEFYAHYSQYTDAGTTYRVFYTDTITQESASALTGQSIYNRVISNSLKTGTVVKCNSDYTSGSYTYKKGHSYLVRGSWVGGLLAISTEDITVVPTNTVLQLTNQQMLDATTDGGFADGQIVTPKDDNGYFKGIFYQMSITEDGGNNQYEWIIINKSLPIGSSVIMGDQNSLQISEGGTYIILGDITSLTITSTEGVVITIDGVLGSLTLPDTSNTVLIKATAYNGGVIANNTPLASGSILGAYTYGLIAER